MDESIQQISRNYHPFLHTSTAFPYLEFTNLSAAKKGFLGGRFMMSDSASSYAKEIAGT